MEQEFGARLRQYRAQKRLTQQELADRLSVSNKTVSRWESGGGYPDVPLLVPLARALGVSVEDLLDGEKPIRALGQADWQTLLSFAFAIGGGILFYLLALFVPAPVCYLIYLGCLAYGVYLQRYYCHRGKWFRLGCGVMNFCVNLSLAFSLLSVPLVLGWAQISLRTAVGGPMGGVWLMVGAALLTLAGLLTAATQWAVICFSTGKRLRRPQFTLRRPRPLLLLPAACMVPLALFWVVYHSGGFPQTLYVNQKWLYSGLLAALALLCLLLSCGRGRRAGLWPTAILVLGGLSLPLFTAKFALTFHGEIQAVIPQLTPLYPRFGAFSPGLAGAAVFFCALCVLSACLRAESREVE